MVDAASGAVGVRVTTVSPDPLVDSANVVGITVDVFAVSRYTWFESKSVAFIGSLKVIVGCAVTATPVALFAGLTAATVGLVQSKPAPVVKLLVAGVAGLPFRSVTVAGTLKVYLVFGCKAYGSCTTASVLPISGYTAIGSALPPAA